MAEEFVKWDEKLNVGIEEIDEQHKQLVAFTNELYAGCTSGKEEANEQFKNTIKKAVKYVKIHFKTEEDLMVKYDYPYYLAHKKEHGDFVKRILQEVKNFEDKKLFVPNRFVRFLKDWLLRHIALSDQKYKSFFQDKGVR